MFIFHRIRTHRIEEPCAFLAFLGGWGIPHWSSLTASVRPIYLRQFIAGTCHVPILRPVLCRTPLAALVVHTLPRPPRSHTYYIRHVNKHTRPRWKTRRETLAQRACPPRVFPQSKLIRHKSRSGVRHGHTGKIFPLFECNIKGIRQANSPPRPSVRVRVCTGANYRSSAEDEVV